MRTETLAQLFTDPGPFASAYVEVSRDSETRSGVAELAVRSVLEDLSDQGAPEKVRGAIRARLEQPTGQPAPVSRCVVASERGVVFDRLSRTERQHPVAHWGRLPELTDWVADASAGVGFTLALVNHEGADVSSYSADGIHLEQDVSVGEPSGFEHKVKGGGWSHLNWQRSSETVWKRNAVEAAAEIERHVGEYTPEVVIIAGDEHSRSDVRAALGDLGVDVVVLDHGSRGADGGADALAEAVESVLRERVVAGRLASAHEAAERLGQGRAVASGVDAVADAFVRGQVGTLLIDPDHARGLELVTAAHPGFGLGAVDPAGTLPADQALIAAAAVTGAEVGVTAATALDGEPVIALLRWDQSPGDGSDLT